MEYLAGMEEMARGSTDMAVSAAASLPESAAVVRQRFLKSLLSAGARLVLGTVTRRLGP